MSPRTRLFAANWKMHMDPAETRRFAAAFLGDTRPEPGREVWFFPPAVSLTAAAEAFGGRSDVRIGAQDVHWEPKGAFTGATSIPLARAAGATAALVGHSERRHVFGETDAETGLKVRALGAAGLVPVLCVGERLAEREAGTTEAVVLRQLAAALDGVDADTLARLVVAYEPVWAIGTGKNATPADAAAVHRTIRADLTGRGAPPSGRILYGGSVNPKNAAHLLAESEIDGVLVGGASLEPASWGAILAAAG